MKFEKLTQEIIGAAIEVHKHLGPGLLESAYEECLSYELTQRGLLIERQKPVPIIFKEVKLDCGYRIDILVNDLVIIELKSVDALIPVHEAQILTYLKFANKQVGLLINFNVKLLKEGIKRYVL
ncbi:MAG: GxxExxY protein [Bacteroidetes bacterium]|nr:GxxExxY protein [Bacteroidota bacterium]